MKEGCRETLFCHFVFVGNHHIRSDTPVADAPGVCEKLTKNGTPNSEKVLMCSLSFVEGSSSIDSIKFAKKITLSFTYSIAFLKELLPTEALFTNYNTNKF